MRLLLLLLAVALPAAVRAGTVPVDLHDAALWKPHADGGREVAVSADPKGGLRLVYRDAPPHWGNVEGACAVPPDAVALRFLLTKRSSAAGAAMHIWLKEPDGDVWMQAVRPNGMAVADLPAGAAQVRLPVAGFGFQPRGPGSRQMTAVRQMLIGCNYADLDVTVSDMRWETSGAALTAPLPITPGLTPEGGRRGSVAILQLDGALPGGFRTAHPPAALAAVLRKAGYGVTLLRAGDLADSAVLTRAHFAALILPYGPCFPRAARAAVQAYLKQGGGLLTSDGYAFDRPLSWTGSGWGDVAAGITAAGMERQAADDVPMNTRFGAPGDAMNFQPSQIPLFDPQHRFHGFISEGKTRVLAAGYSAVGLIGLNNPVFPPVYRRWIPLLPAVDGSGKTCGTALGLMRNYSGPYAGSSWAFSGITNGADLFLKTPARRARLVRVVDQLVNGLYLHDLASRYASYQPGEGAEVSVVATNDGAAGATIRVRLGAGTQAEERSVTLAPGASQAVRMTVKAPATGGLVPLRATIARGGEVVDTQEDAFWVRGAKMRPFELSWQGNYFAINGKPRILLGSNETGMVFFSPHETPATWERDFSLMERSGLHILRVLHFSPFAREGATGPGPVADMRNRPERLCRQVDALVDIARSHGVAIFLTLHDWQPLALTDEELAIQKDWARFWAARYRDVSSVFFDLQNEPDVDVPDAPHVTALWNAWLKERYGSDEALRQAWGARAPEAPLPNVPLGTPGDRWDDKRAADRGRFQTVVLDRWVKANVEGLRQGNPKALAAVGFLEFMHTGDRVLGTRFVDISNQHYYAGMKEFAGEFKLIDRRFLGKGMSLGEFGARDAHDARTRGEDDLHEEQSIRRFLNTIHAVVGMGGAFALNWDLKEMDEMIFPWGLVGRGDGAPKPWLAAMAGEARLLEQVHPRYESPAVFLLLPDSHRVGPRLQELYKACARSADLLLDQRVDFGVANEEDLDRLPASARLLYWPLPYCPDDATFDRVLAWVRAGGTLYLSGDIAFDANRQPTRRARRSALGLPDTAPPVGPFDAPAGAAPLVEAAGGRGRVLFAPYPLELRSGSDAGDRAAYARALALAGIRPIALEPADAPVRVLSIATEEGGRLYTLLRTDDGTAPLTVKLPAAGKTITLPPGGSAFVLTPGGSAKGRMARIF